MKRFRIHSLVFIVLFMLVMLLQPAKVEATKIADEEQKTTTDSTVQTLNLSDGGFKIKYSGKQYTYTKKPVSILVNNVKIKTAMPGVIINGVSLVPANSVYAKSALGVAYSYDKSTKKITLSNKSTTIVMTIGSKTSYVNGKKKSLTQAPQLINLVATNKNYVMVPARFVSTNLGYQYIWDKVNNSSVITTSEKEDNATEEGNEDNTVIDPSNPDSNQGEVITPSEPDDSNSDDTNHEEEPEGYSLKILRSSDVNTEEIVTTDDYVNRQFIITIPGDYTKYYKENPPIKVNNLVKSVSVKLNDYGDTDIIIKTSKVKAFVIDENSQALFVTVKEPKEVYDKVIVIDAGHGGNDTGALGNSLYEKNLTLSIVQYAKDYLDNEDDIKVYYTRLQDFENNITKGNSNSAVKSTSESLVARYKFANETGADIFISVHINAAGNKSARGTEVYYSSKNKNTNDAGLTSKKLADISLPYLLEAIGSSNRKVKDGPNLAVLKYTNMPAILMEMAFISNSNDAAILKSEEKKDAMGYAIYETVLEAVQY